MKHKTTYDRTVVGMRLKQRRKQMGWTREYVSAKIGIVEKYYADIERGTCGMSIETMLALAEIFGFSLDEFIYGKVSKTQVDEKLLEEQMKCLSPEEKECCAQMVYLFTRGIKEQV